MSRPRSGRGVSAGGTRPAAQRGVYVQAPKPDIYVALLGVALAAMVIGCLLLILVLNNYGFSTKVSAASSHPAPAFALAGPAGISEKLGTVRL